MEDLPLEILCKILSYLDGPQLLDAGLVCKRWLHASGMLLKDVALNVTRGFVPDVTSGRPYVRINFWDSHIDDSCVDLINRFEVLHLKFTGCTAQNSLTSIVNCDKLLTLETNDVEVLSLFDSLPSLETLDLSYARDVNDETLRRAELYGPRLKVFRLSSDPSYYNKDSDPDLTPPAIEEFVRFRANTLKLLELPYYISPEVLLNISKLKNLKLESIILSHNSECSSVIVEFCENQPSITALVLDSVEDLSDLNVGDILKCLPALEEFSAVYNTFEINQCIIPMFARPNMRRINLNFALRITPDSFSTAISSLACFNLRVLSLGYTELEEKHVRALLPLVPCLEELDLSSLGLSDDGFREASFRLTRLRKLKLNDCLFISGRKLDHLSGLVELSFRSSDNITNEGLLEGVRFPHLKYLDLYRSSAHHTVASIRSKLMEQNPCLITINVEQ